MAVFGRNDSKDSLRLEYIGPVISGNGVILLHLLNANTTMLIPSNNVTAFNRDGVLAIEGSLGVFVEVPSNLTR